MKPSATKIDAHLDIQRPESSARASSRALWPLLAAFLLGSSLATSQAQNPTDVFDALARAASLARNSERLDEAIPLYRKALAVRPQWAEGWWSLGTIEYDRNEYAAAASDFQKLVPLAPQDGTARAMLGLCEFELGQDQAALKDLQEGRALSVASDPQFQQVVLYHEATLLLRTSQFKMAQNTLGMLCKMDAESDPVLESMALAVLRVPPNQASHLRSTNSSLLRRVGQADCLTAKKQFDRAAQEYARLLNDSPSFDNLHYAYGLSLAASSNIPAAVEQFKAEIALHPDNVAPRLEIAADLYKKDSATALPYAQEAVRLSPQLPFAHYLLGLLLLDTNAYQKAIPELEVAAKAFPRETKIFFALGTAYARAGRTADAANARSTFARLSKEAQPETSSY